ncbi:copper chaperone PCu(A)C [Thalassospiraceae bacterium LMO-SO8]|nr:copper chaperone PCu(A)C [Alphaproteobacteria bacterium LMO-S08]WND76959.1 copper chaperone PCu(A)C [Thalassospiraceae bacterium LMO-SO8]
MKTMTSRPMAALFAAVLSLSLPNLVWAHDAKSHEATAQHGITVTGAWARPTIAKMRISAAYFQAAIAGGEDKLIAAKTANAEKAELHRHVMENGVAKMRPVDSVAVAPGQPAVFQPGGYHVMIMGLKGPLNEGDSFPLTLTFEKAGNVTVNVMVMKKAAQDHGNMDHGAHKH